MIKTNYTSQDLTENLKKNRTTIEDLRPTHQSGSDRKDCTWVEGEERGGRVLTLDVEIHLENDVFC